ncbi:hypothetical protein AAFF_G00427620 [Aldrovandia affinis]|uniref:Uncharacterized protein n=1 Tax=Aldrovandia affinis TaxID=143900 RepID=A0AAD7S9K0_9TELE|nr:hypothetical protein AAFF_G00427620 [Aldrovandia affinis]
MSESSSWKLRPLRALSRGTPVLPVPLPPPSRHKRCGPAGVTLRPPPYRQQEQLDPLRRHSWDPGAAALGYPQYEHHSVSLEDLNPEEIERILGGAFGGLRGRDPRRAPITHYTQDFGSLLSLTEEEVGPDPQHFSLLEEQSSQLQGCSASAPSLFDTLAESQLLSSTPHPPPWPRPCPHSNCSETSLYSAVGGSTQSVDAGSELGSVDWGREDRTEGQQGNKEEREEKTGSPLGRTISFLRKMAGTRKVRKRYTELEESK